jgi:hypothetical protein
MAVLEPGGAQLGALRLRVALRAHGIGTRMLAGFATSEGVALCRAHGVPVEVWGGCGRVLQYARRPDFVAWLRPRLAGADLVHGHMFGGWWAAAEAALESVPLAASEHNDVRWPGRPELAGMRRALRRVGLLFAHGPPPASSSHRSASHPNASAKAGPRLPASTAGRATGSPPRGSCSPAGCTGRRDRTC